MLIINGIARHSNKVNYAIGTEYKHNNVYKIGDVVLVDSSVYKCFSSDNKKKSKHTPNGDIVNTTNGYLWIRIGKLIQVISEYITYTISPNLNDIKSIQQYKETKLEAVNKNLSNIIHKSTGSGIVLKDYADVKQGEITNNGIVYDVIAFDYKHLECVILDNISETIKSLKYTDDEHSLTFSLSEVVTTDMQTKLLIKLS